MFKSLFAAALVAVASPVAPSATAFVPVDITYDEYRMDLQYPLVNQVICNKGRGSAFRVGPQRFLSVAHVTSLGNCRIDGHPITIVEEDTELDFSIVDAGPPKGGAIRINCGGFKTSEWYWSTGYALGRPRQTNVAIYSSAFENNVGYRMFVGRYTVIPGMSGGAVLNSEGEAVGMVNAYHPIFGLSYSRPLSDTSVCRNA